MMKIKSLQLLKICLMILALAACSTTGNLALKNESPIMVVSKFKVGASTKESIINEIGAPNDIMLTESGLEILIYEYSRTSPRLRNFTPLILFSSAFDKELRQVKFLLNKNKTLKSVAINETSVRETFGLAE